MKDTIKQIIESNLPEKKEYDWSKDEHTKTCKDGCTYCCNADGMITGFNQALSQINTSLIADEVLKVVVEVLEGKVKQLRYVFGENDVCTHTDSMDSMCSKCIIKLLEKTRMEGENICVGRILQLLSNLSPHK